MYCLIPQLGAKTTKLKMKILVFTYAGFEAIGSYKIPSSPLMC